MRKNNRSSQIRELEEYCSKYGTFTQSALWAKVKNNWQAEYITAKDENGQVCGSVLVLVKKLPFGQVFLYAPRGPVCDTRDLSVLNDLISQAICLTQKYKAFMLRVDPMILENDVEAIENLKRLGFVHHSKRIGYENIQCRENFVLDVYGKGEEEVFASFKPKWRYNIRLALKKGVKCSFYGTEKLDDFMFLMKQTAEHDDFQYRERTYFERILCEFGDRATLCMSYLEDEPLSGALCIEYGGVMSYVYGCSSSKNRNYMPNYLMQWTMICRAIQNNCNTYDFCGIPYWNMEEHPNYGVYRFKRGFNGHVVTYAGEFDYRRQPFTCWLFDIMRLKVNRIFGRRKKFDC